jgi:tetratricopeptide (TPR) repeat protein
MKRSPNELARWLARVKAFFRGRGNSCPSACESLPTDAMDDFNRGIAYQEKGELDQAIASYTKAIAILPQYADVYYQRGLAYFAQGDYERAIVDYNQTLEINPLFVDAHMKIDEAWKCRINQAIASETKAIALNPLNAKPHINRGKWYAMNADYDNAIADFDRALQLDPYSFEAHDEVRLALYDKGDPRWSVYEQALSELESAIEQGLPLGVQQHLIEKLAELRNR